MNSARDLKVDRKGLKKALTDMGITKSLESRILGEVYFMLSLECNLRCKVCAWWGIKGPCRDADFLSRFSSSLSLKQLKRLIDQIAEFHPKTVSFSGGEPLLYKKWYPLADYIHKKGIKVSLTTNGMLLYENFSKVKDAVDEINLSLGGPPSILNLIRENPPSHFRQIMKGLEKITTYKKKHGNRPSLRILYTISDLSYLHMEELIRFMSRHGIEIDHYKFQHLMFISPATFKAQKETFRKEFNISAMDLWQGYTYVPGKMDMSRFSEEIRKVKSYDNVSFNPELSEEELKDYYAGNKGALSYARYCTAPWHQIDIMPDGQAYICHDYFIGNIKDGQFEEVWNGPAAKRLRGYLADKLFPGCKGCFYHYCDREK